MSTTTTTTTEPSPALPPPVNLGDFAAVKRALDDAVSAAVLDAVGGGGEDGRVYWGKVAIGVVSCAVALLAQFYPGKPPATTPLLAVCVAAYAALSAGLTAIATFVERDAFLFTKGGCGLPPLAVGARMARFDPGYELVVEERGGKGKRARAVASLNATSLVRADGRVDKGAVVAAVAGVLAKFDAAAKRK